MTLAELKQQFLRKSSEALRALDDALTANYAAGTSIVVGSRRAWLYTQEEADALEALHERVRVLVREADDARALLLAALPEAAAAQLRAKLGEEPLTLSVRCFKRLAAPIDGDVSA